MNQNQKAQKQDKDADILMRRVGDRVRGVREMKGISRKQLSESSGLSLRYLAQLEAGEGNISIALLSKLASSLGHKMEWFLDEEDPWNSDLYKFIELFRASNSRQREKIFDILRSENFSGERSDRFCLIGLRGAGKSSLGKQVAQDLDLTFIELTSIIEDNAGMPVNEVVALYGQEGYRHLELEALKHVAKNHEKVILAVAGGVVSDPDNFNYLLSHFNTIWIKAKPEEHMLRVMAQGDMRPMSGNPEALSQLKRILENRMPLYERAHSLLDTSEKSFEQSSEELSSMIYKHRSIHIQ